MSFAIYLPMKTNKPEFGKMLSLPLPWRTSEHSLIKCSLFIRRKIFDIWLKLIKLKYIFYNNPQKINALFFSERSDSWLESIIANNPTYKKTPEKYLGCWLLHVLQSVVISLAAPILKYHKFEFLHISTSDKTKANCF